MHFVVGIAPIAAQTLELNEDNDDVDIIPHLLIVGDQNFDLKDNAQRQGVAQNALEAPAFARVNQDKVGERTWAYVRIKNASESGISRVLDSEHFTSRGYAVYLERAGIPELILDARLPAVEIKDRLRPELILASNPIILEPQEAVGLWVQFETKSSDGAFPIYLRSEAILTDHRTKHSKINLMFYGVSVTLLIFLVLLSSLLKSRPARFYAIFLLGMIALNLQQDGYFSLFLYSGDSIWNFYTRMFWQVIMVVFYLLFMASFLNLRNRHPILSKVTAIFILFVFLYGVSHPIWDVSELYRYGTAGIGVMFGFLSVAFIVLAFKARTDGLWFFVAGVGIFLSYLAYSLAHGFLWEYGFNFEVIATVKVLQLLDASVFSAAMLRQTFVLRQQRDAALNSELAATQESLTATRLQLEAERDRDRAKVLAEKHRERLAMTSHDLRQPLTSLQLALEQAETSDPDLKSKLASGLEYLNVVLGDTLRSARPNGDGADEHAAPTEIVPIQVVFDNLERMFGAEAKAKGLELRFDPSAATVRTDAIALVRMLSNLISNAIKYTDDGLVEVLCVEEGDTASIKVRDGGSGLTEAQLARFKEPYERNESDGDGEGLGLHIVTTMAKQSSLLFDAESSVGKGTVFRLSGFPICT